MDTIGIIMMFVMLATFIFVTAIAYLRKKAENDRMEKEMNADKHK